MPPVIEPAGTPPSPRRLPRLATIPSLAALTALLVGGLAPAAQATPGDTPDASPSAPATAAEADRPDPLAEYLFTDGERASVPNTAPGHDGPGAAEVQHSSSRTWTDTSLRLTGGDKHGNGSWVRLPEDLLKERSSVSITTEVKIDASMRNDFNFLWNVGGENTDKYFFATAKDAPRSAITVASNSGEDSAESSSDFEADHWTSVTSVLDGDAGTLTFYLDGTRTGSVKTDLTPSDIPDQSLNTIGRSPGRISCSRARSAPSGSIPPRSPRTR